ncbi:uncharacterized protein LOC133545412 isoform X2 [Nerophis ophidion]|uniref:uncharacterized protein LOC133545412 isoform X2 n=1 Tax=Nerophis ophidion TaxID=159077 RepID=UPI002AE01723|nr:uncharacterized protein LOC133545412 isoform X2 [Nerophis ophidion]
MCERTIAKYEEELCPTKEEKKRRHQKHQVVLHRTDIHQLIEHQEECLPHLQGDSLTLEYPQPSHFKGDKEDPQPPYFKEEEEGECPVRQEEADLSKFPLTVVSVKTEEHEDKPPESSQLQHSPKRDFSATAVHLFPSAPSCLLLKTTDEDECENHSNYCPPARGAHHQYYCIEAGMWYIISCVCMTYSEGEQHTFMYGVYH